MIRNAFYVILLRYVQTKYILKAREICEVKMKLRGRIAVSFIVVMIIPLILINVSFFMIIKTRFSMDDDKAISEKNGIVASIANPMSFISRIIVKDYNELELCLRNSPELLESREYLDKFSDKISKKYSYIYVTRNRKLLYGKNMELYNRIGYEFPSYTYEIGESRGYFEDDGFQVIVRYLGKSQRGMEVFFVTNILELEAESKLAWGQLTASFVLIMLLTGLILSYWLYKSIAKPIGSLRKSTRHIIEGDLDTEITRHKDDEIGDLSDDFDNMRRHIQELLEDNITKKQNMKEMIVNISHDLKTPLTVIKGYAEGLREGVANTPEKQDKYLSIIYSKAIEMNSLIEELSTYAKIDMDEVSYNFITLDINEYLEEGFEEIKTDLEINGFEVYYHPYKEKLEVIADADQLKRVINNLISNSKKYAAKDRKGRIDIRVSPISDFARIEIEDNGVGIPKDSLERIFERLYRVDESRNSKAGGSGLGLAIVKKIIEAHNGKVWAESIEGCGTKIIILLRNAKFTTSKEILDKKEQNDSSRLFMGHKWQAGQNMQRRNNEQNTYNRR